MIEVFKTNVLHYDHAQMLVSEIGEAFTNYRVNFDLTDCDKILRVECTTGSIQAEALMELLHSFGFEAEILPDDQPVIEGLDYFTRFRPN